MVFPVHAQWAGWDYDNDREIKPWSELQAKIPPYPKDPELIQFDAGSATAHRFFIDPGSLSIGEDGVVRYIMVIRTGGGASNVTFEGMRCETREQKTYAIGHHDGTWSRARDPQWRRIEYREVNRHHGVLYREFFCRGKFAARSVNDIVSALRYPPAMSTNQ
jgi:hypothetical protein